MCRFVVYKGRRLLMADLLTRPNHSLIKQSYQAVERTEPLNGDGFGVGWYAPEIDPIPCVWTSTTPAWNNRNLRRLAEKIMSPCIFAHVRAASPGMLVSEVNCHPFQHDRFLWMHNGMIPDFIKLKRRLRQSLRDEFYHMIQGTTDSEHAFAVFLNQLADRQADGRPEDLQHAMLATIEQLNVWTREAGIRQPAYYNFAVTDGETVIVTRYVSDPGEEPASLYYSHGAKFICHDGYCHMVAAESHEHAVIIASEPLTGVKDDWERIPRNHLVIVSPQLDVRLIAI